MKTKSLVALIFVAVSTVALTTNLYAGCGGCGTHTTTGKLERTGSDLQYLSIVETAMAAGSFNTLVKAVKAAGLAETLSGTGPFTVFAPTDEAFAQLPKGTVDQLLKNPEKLASILTYHVVPGKLQAADVIKMKGANTVHGASFTIDVNDKGVKVDQARVLETDILCSNGIIHIIDQVILPRNIVETAASAGSFSTLLAAVEAAGLVETLSGDGPFTVFAPTDEAFGKLPEGTIESLLNDKQRLTEILTYHVVSGKVLADEVGTLTSAETVEGRMVQFDSTAGVRVNQARVIASDVVTANGVIHVIDEVLIPN